MDSEPGEPGVFINIAQMAIREIIYSTVMEISSLAPSLRYLRGIIQNSEQVIIYALIVISICIFPTFFFYLGQFG